MLSIVRYLARQPRWSRRRSAVTVANRHKTTRHSALRAATRSTRRRPPPTPNVDRSRSAARGWATICDTAAITCLNSLVVASTDRCRWNRYTVFHQQTSTTAPVPPTRHWRSECSTDTRSPAHADSNDRIDRTNTAPPRSLRRRGPHHPWIPWLRTLNSRYRMRADRDGGTWRSAASVVSRFGTMRRSARRVEHRSTALSPHTRVTPRPPNHLRPVDHRHRHRHRQNPLRPSRRLGPHRAAIGS